MSNQDLKRTIQEILLAGYENSQELDAISANFTHEELNTPHPEEDTTGEHPIAPVRQSDKARIRALRRRIEAVFK